MPAHDRRCCRTVPSRPSGHAARHGSALITTDERDLPALVRAAHEHVVRALEVPEVHGVAGVALCSAHLTAVDGVLYAEAHRRLPEAHDRLQAARAADRLLQHAIGRLDRRLTGDTHLGHVPVEQVVDEVLSALEGHARAEGRLLEQLGPALSGDERDALARRLAAATISAPTRPHPHVPHTPLAPLVGRLEAAVDRLRDALDNRVGATGRTVKAPRPLGRWGSYLMGVPGPEREPHDQEVGSPTAEPTTPRPRLPGRWRRPQRRSSGPH